MNLIMFFDMGHIMEEGFDFDRWKHLAKEDPQRFEELRLQVIEQYICASAPSNQQRLRCLQFQIDARRRLSSSAMGACIMISGMMFDHLHNKLIPALDHFLYTDDGAEKARPVEHKANVLKFRQ